MKTKGVGIALLVIGILMTIYTGFNYVTTKKVVDIGPIQINKEENHPVQWAPIVGVIIIVIGGFLVVKSSTNKE
jgi:uncharacterized membrane protein YdcZ (DUF606 family)